MTTRTKPIAALALAVGAWPGAGCVGSPVDVDAMQSEELAHASRTNHNPALFAPDAHPYGGPVYFLPDPPPGGRTSVTVPRHTAIAVLLSSALGARCVDADTVADITGTLDGVALRDLDDYAFTSSRLTTFTGDTRVVSRAPCSTGSPQVAAIEARFMLVKPLDPGVHVLTTHLTTTAGTVRDRTSTITVPAR